MISTLYIYSKGDIANFPEKRLSCSSFSIFLRSSIASIRLIDWHCRNINKYCASDVQINICGPDIWAVRSSDMIWCDVMWYIIWYNIWYDIWNMIYEIWYDMTWHDMTWHGMAWHDMALHDMKWHDVIWYIIWYHMIWYGIIWHDMTWQRQRTMHELPWITILGSRVRPFAHYFHEWRSHEWKPSANRITSDPKIIIHGNECIILFITDYLMSWSHNPAKIIIDLVIVDKDSRFWFIIVMSPQLSWDVTRM